MNTKKPAWFHIMMVTATLSGVVVAIITESSAASALTLVAVIAGFITIGLMMEYEINDPKRRG